MSIIRRPGALGDLGRRKHLGQQLGEKRPSTLAKGLEPDPRADIPGMRMHPSGRLDRTGN